MNVNEPFPFAVLRKKTLFLLLRFLFHKSLACSKAQASTNRQQAAAQHSMLALSDWPSPHHLIRIHSLIHFTHFTQSDSSP